MKYGASLGDPKRMKKQRDSFLRVSCKIPLRKNEVKFKKKKKKDKQQKKC